MRFLTSQIKPFFSLILTSLGHVCSPRRIPILLYHSVDNTGSVVSITPGDFEAHMRYLKRNDYMTMTFGAGGSTRDGSYQSVKTMILEKKANH